MKFRWFFRYSHAQKSAACNPGICLEFQFLGRPTGNLLIGTLSARPNAHLAHLAGICPVRRSIASLYAEPVNSDAILFSQRVCSRCFCKSASAIKFSASVSWLLTLSLTASQTQRERLEDTRRTLQALRRLPIGDALPLPPTLPLACAFRHGFLLSLYAQRFPRAASGSDHLPLNF